MGCATVGNTIVCGRGRAIRGCVGCGALSTHLCDFKVLLQGVSRRSGLPWQRHGTCSAPICERCTTRLPGDKDACPAHRDACLEACRQRGLALPA